jgi:16S rRNA (guanine527-N7)-methyltransferase
VVLKIERIAELLAPFLKSLPPTNPEKLGEAQLQQVSSYLDLLLHWNSRINLTAVRDSENIVSRHFGESFFLAAYLFAAGPLPGANVVDVGSGAGFPGIPLKICVSSLHVTLVESNRKKATFLREVIRVLQLSDMEVFAGRAEDLTTSQDVPPRPVDVVTMRAVEKFESALSTGADLVRTRTGNLPGRLALLIGMAQAARVPELLPDLRWADPVLIPQSSQRVILVGEYQGG